MTSKNKEEFLEKLSSLFDMCARINNAKRSLIKRRIADNAAPLYTLGFMDINKKIAEELGVKLWQVEAAVGLIDEGNTIPFISRYRKEVTGALNDEQLRTLDERLKYLRNLPLKNRESLQKN